MIKWKLNREKRSKVHQELLDLAYKKLSEGIDKKISKNGGYTWESMHEIYGIIGEEWHEAVKAMHQNDLDEFEAELIDIATAAIWGVACIEHLKKQGIYYVRQD